MLKQTIIITIFLFVTFSVPGIFSSFDSLFFIYLFFHHNPPETKHQNHKNSMVEPVGTVLIELKTRYIYQTPFPVFFTRHQAMIRLSTVLVLLLLSSDVLGYSSPLVTKPGRVIRKSIIDHIRFFGNITCKYATDPSINFLELWERDSM